jgi:hypothetical protein
MEMINPSPTTVRTLYKSVYLNGIVKGGVCIVEYMRLGKEERFIIEMIFCC